MTTTENVRNELKTLEDPTYREFHSSLIPSADNILGVRIPQLRTMAKEIAKKEDWRTFVEATDTLYYEETMLQGMVIGRAKMEPEERIKYIRLFVPRINNWAVCDIFSGELKTAARKGKETIWQFVQPYLESKEEYQLRFGIVMLFHYVDEEHIDSLLAYADRFTHGAYYARMAMAWMISICFIKFPDKTMKYHFRPDYTSYHVAVYDTLTGEFIKGVTHQGYSDDSMWARGQAWAIYGYTVVYRETKDVRYLDFVQKVTDVYLKNLPEDYVPYWDFNDPSIPDAPRDASAACVVASALLELSGYLPAEKALEYKQAAVKMLASLSSDKYQCGKSKPAFLLHSTGHLPAGSEIDASIIYADYYYMEALLRLKRLTENKPVIDE